MNLLINEPPLQVLPSLARKVGLNEAIFLQQLHFRLQIATNVRDGYKWIYKTHEEWREEFPFWSIDTIKRVIRKLENEEYIITSSKYNKMKMDRTKWYRVNYKMAQQQSVQVALMEGASCTNGTGQNAPTHQGKMHSPITKEVKSIKKNSVEKDLDYVSVIEYLNQRTNKNFKASSKSTQRLINGRISEGHEFEDFKQVIDLKAKEWLNDNYWNKYLRPSTLFNATNFENYLNECSNVKADNVTKPINQVAQPPQLDFGEGEE